jgi:hypothetical protein
MSVRRAVVVDGAIQEKKLHPKCQEIVGISRLLENERERQGIVNVPRFTTDLVERCVRTNDPVMWRAANDDIDTGDFDPHAANIVLARYDILPAMFVGCVSEATTSDHLADVLCVFQEMLPSLSDDVVSSFSKAISTQWKSFTNVLIRTVEPTKRPFKEGIYVAISRFVDATDMQGEAVLTTAREILKHKKFELLSIFARMDSSILSPLLPDLVAAARTASATNRYAVVSLIAKIARETDDVTADVLPTIKIVMEKSVQDKYADVRTIRAATFLLEKFSDDPMLKMFATLVSWNLNSGM